MEEDVVPLLMTEHAVVAHRCHQVLLDTRLTGGPAAVIAYNLIVSGVRADGAIHLFGLIL